MTDRYQKTFAKLKKQNRPGFCPFAVLGHPNKQESLKRIQIYLKSNPDFLELGIPFSDPIADGPTIQVADEEAIKSGITPPIALQIIAQIRKINSEIPIGILTYSNIVIQYGIQKFYHDLKKSGADSILIADAPLEEIKPFAIAAKQNKLHQIFIVSETTTPQRLKLLQKAGGGFLYVVSTLGVTGTRKTLNSNVKTLITKIKKQTRLPLMIGFGISTSAHIRDLKKVHPEGLIVGSALVKTPTVQLLKLANSLSNAVNES